MASVGRADDIGGLRLRLDRSQNRPCEAWTFRTKTVGVPEDPVEVVGVSEPRLHVLEHRILSDVATP